jgi:hypothetical protein
MIKFSHVATALLVVQGVFFNPGKIRIAQGVGYVFRRLVFNLESVHRDLFLVWDFVNFMYAFAVFITSVAVSDFHERLFCLFRVGLTPHACFFGTGGKCLR